jgi:hypothetical protein
MTLRVAEDAKWILSNYERVGNFDPLSRKRISIVAHSTFSHRSILETRIGSDNRPKSWIRRLPVSESM